jgi:glycosyltransferase involved in cell wall biosynthesis
MLNNPIISVIVPCYNQAEYLNECLESVVKQSYDDWECIIVNDGSTDDTDIIVQEWLERDKRFKYIKIKNGGVCNARNKGIDLAAGVYILPLDADDKIGEDYLKLAIKRLVENPTLKVVYCNAEKFGTHNRTWKLKPYSISNLAKDSMIFCSAVYRKRDWERIGGYDVNMVEGLEDWEFWIALLKGGDDVEKIDSVQFHYRVKQDSRNKKLNDESKKKLFNYMSVKHADFFIKHNGSFMEMEKKYDDLYNLYDKSLRSRKYIANQFFKTFFGFRIFK